MQLLLLLLISCAAAAAAGEHVLICVGVMVQAVVVAIAMPIGRQGSERLHGGRGNVEQSPVEQRVAAARGSIQS